MKPVLFACGFPLLHAFAVLASPAHAKALSWAFLVTAPLVAAAGAFWRCRRDSFRPSHGWSAAALAMLFWSASGLAWAHQDLFGDIAAPLRLSMYLYVMRAVPLAWVISSAWKGSEPPIVRAIDVLLVVTLGLLYLGFAFSATTLEGASNATPPIRFTLAADVMNVFRARRHAGALRDRRVRGRAQLLRRNRRLRGDRMHGVRRQRATGLDHRRHLRPARHAGLPRLRRARVARFPPRMRRSRCRRCSRPATFTAASRWCCH